MTKKKKGEADADEGVRTVLYVVNRPYSAGEAPDIVKAQVKKEYEDDPDTLDLTFTDPQTEEAAEAKRARRSDRQEPATWHEGGK